tara:strand:- start:2682 stop:4010 length:1329 start_codon:yes stop_codon:yes gene_type:complete
MIPKIQELVDKQSQWNAQQQSKNKWRTRREMALDYYNGRTERYTKKYFSSTLSHKVPIANVNITKRIIDRISLVYMVAPKRQYTDPDIVNYFVEKDFKMQRLERFTNLLDSCLVKVTFRNGLLDYDIIHDFEPMFGDDPLRPIGYTYPISTKSEVLDTTPELFAYWDMENTFIYDRNGKIYDDADNPEHINFYGMLPFVECFREGRPEYAYLDTEPVNDIIKTNTVVNVAETNKSANIHFQSFGYIYANGSQIDKKDLQIGQDQIYYLGVDGTLNVTSPPNSVPALTDSIKESYKMLAQNYHLPTSFADGTTAESGVALRLRNQELQDDKKSDIVKWNDVEKNLFNVERQVLTTELMINPGELESVDFGETADILSAKEQRDQWEWELSKGIIDVADILMQKDPDRFPDRESAQDYLFDRQEEEVMVQEETSPLLEALTTPT